MLRHINLVGLLYVGVIIETVRTTQAIEKVRQTS
jgi:hypothetical protein